MEKDYLPLAKKIKNKKWMLYGAYGYTGRLILEESLKLGLKPILAGRSIGKLRALATEHDLPWRLVELENEANLNAALEDVDLVYHAAGPFVKTAQPMREACLQTGTHYVDVTGELPVLRDTFAAHERAKESGVLLLSSNGVNCVPTDCLVGYLLKQIDDVQSIEVAIDTVRERSAGSLISMLEMTQQPGQVRRNGQIKQEPVGARIKRVRFNHKVETVLSLPLVDIDTLYWLSGASNITAYVAQPALLALGMKWSAGMNRFVFANNLIRQRVQQWLRQQFPGPDENARAHQRTYVWAKARNRTGRVKEAWLETLDGYQLTAAIAPRAVCEILSQDHWGGAYTPAQALGSEFVLNLPETVRFAELNRLSEGVNA